MKLTFNQWVQYPTTEEAQHRLRFIRVRVDVINLCSKGKTGKIKTILYAMGLYKFSELERLPDMLKDFEGYLKKVLQNILIHETVLLGYIYPKYPPAPRGSTRRETLNGLINYDDRTA